MATIMSVLAMLASPAAGTTAEYKPKFPFCNTPSCDRRAELRQQRRAERRAKRRVQARHKAEVRWRAKMRRFTAPYRGWLASTRACESGGRYTINTGNGFFGAYQFTLSSWRAVGGQGMPHHAPPLEQDYRAVRLLHVQGRGAWPNCG